MLRLEIFKFVQIVHTKAPVDGILPEYPELHSHLLAATLNVENWGHPQVVPVNT